MCGDDLQHDVEVGLSAAGVQGIECVLGVGVVEALALRQFGEQVLARGLDAECVAAGGKVGPDQRHRGSAVEYAVAAVEQVVEGIQAGAERPVDAGHEDAVDLVVEGRDVADAGAVEGEGVGHGRRCRGGGVHTPTPRYRISCPTP